MRLSPYQKLIATVIFALSLAGISVWIFGGLSASARNGITMLQEIESRIAILEGERKAARLFDSFSEERQEELGRIRRFFPNRERPVELIEELEKLARDTKNSISIDVDEGKSKIGKDLVFRLTVEGSQKSPRDYLKLLLLLPYEIRVEDMVFQKITTAQKDVSSLPTYRLLAVISVNPALDSKILNPAAR